MNDDFDDLADDTLDRELRRHLAATLDAHVGSAGRAFRASAGVPSRRRWAITLATAGSLAAAMAVTWAIMARHLAANARESGQVVASTRPETPAAPEPIEQIMAYATTDEGTVVLEDQGPARQLRRTVVETVQFYDPQRQGQIEITVPREQTILIGMQTY